MFAGGIAGALARTGFVRGLPFHQHGWPWASFVANVAGTILLAYFTTRFQERLPPSTFPRPLLGTGLCGALTTFSTFQIEVVELVRHGQAALAVGYVVASIGLGLVLMHLVTGLTRRGGFR